MKKLPSMEHLEKLHIPYDVKEVTIIKETKEVGPKLGLEVNQALKTLILKGSSGKFYLCVIGAGHKIKIKKMKRIANESNMEMASPKEVAEQTGYVVGGIPAFAFRNKLNTFIETTLRQYDIVAVGAGKRGTELLLSPKNLQKASEGTFADIISTKL